MTRRQLLAATAAGDAPVMLPMHRATDLRAQSTTAEFRRFWDNVWPEAVRSFSRCGVRFATTDGTVEIRKSPAGRPEFRGLRTGAINLVLVDRIPMYWDNGRGLAGLTGLYEGHHLCAIAISRAHAHQAPLVSVNTVVHELLHLLLEDAFVSRPSAYETQKREIANDWAATRMWLSGGCADVRKAAAAYRARLLSSGSTR